MHIGTRLAPRPLAVVATLALLGACDRGPKEILLSGTEKQVNYFVDIKVRGNNIIERLYARYLPCPFLSLLIDDCIKKGKDYHAGGARYNTTYIQGVGLGTMTDSLSSIKFHIFENKTLSMGEFIDYLDVNYEGHERFRQQILNRTPKYGNDDDFADSVMRRIIEIYFHAVDGRQNTKGGEYHINLLPTTVHVYF